MTDNEIGYMVYCWDRAGYHFIPIVYGESRDFTGYLKYYTDEQRNKTLIESLLASKAKN